MAPIRPLPTGNASSHAFAGDLYQSVRLPWALVPVMQRVIINNAINRVFIINDQLGVIKAYSFLPG